MAVRSLLILHSYHNKNTEKIANSFTKVLAAAIKAPQQTDPEELRDYDLIGFGSGIYDGRHHKALLDLADKLPQVVSWQAFIFSTCGIPAFGMTEEYAAKNHSSLREKLRAKGYTIIDEFSCVGHNTNSFLKLFGGINKGRPNAEDLKRAEAFARKLKLKAPEGQEF